MKTGHNFFVATTKEDLELELVNLSWNLIDGKKYIIKMNLEETPIGRYSKHFSMEYDLYYSDFNECEIGELLEPDYFETLYSDYDFGASINEEVTFNGCTFVKLHNDTYKRID